METIEKLWFEQERIFIKTGTDKTFSRPLEAFPVLKNATRQQREAFKIGTDKTDIRWEALDEDIHINSFFTKAEPDYDNVVAKALKRFPQINISAFAAQIGINKSLLAKYIYGIKKPSRHREKQIEKALHDLGRELIAVEL